MCAAAALKSMRFLFTLFGFFLWVAHARALELTVSAAASLGDVMTAIAKDYQQQHGVKVRFNFASSGTLQRQIEQGAPIDVYVAAADKNMDELAARKLVLPQTRREVARNRLVLIVPKNNRLPLHRFKDVLSDAVTHVAMGAPSVPAGLRAQEVFTKLGIWSQVQRKAVRGKDVREVLTQVALGNVEAGVVYRTDALISARVRIVSVAPLSMHAPIRYPAAVVSDSRKINVARAFVSYLGSARAKTQFKKYGFVTK